MDNNNKTKEEIIEENKKETQIYFDYLVDVSLEDQFFNALDTYFLNTKKSVIAKEKKKNKDKTEDKNSYVYSYRDYINKSNVVINFAKFLKREYPQITNILELKNKGREIFEEYLVDKKLHNCAPASIKNCHDNLVCINKILNQKYNLNLNFTEGINLPYTKEDIEKNKYRNYVAPEEHIEMVKREMYNKKEFSDSDYGILGLFNTGIRGSDMINLKIGDLDLRNGIITIIKNTGKTTLTQKIILDEEGIGLFEEIRHRAVRKYGRFYDKKSDIKLLNVGTRAIQKAFQGYAKKLGIYDIYSYYKTGLHAFRKLKAQKIYDNCRTNMGMNKEEALSFVQKAMKHNSRKTTKSYVLNQW